MPNAPRTSPSRAQRRSARIPLRVRVTISLANNSQFDSETVTISRYGAKLRLSSFTRHLVSGDHVRISQRGTYSWRSARVAWIDRHVTGCCGIELQDPENFWGVFFPQKSRDVTGTEEAAGYTPLALRDMN